MASLKKDKKNNYLDNSFLLESGSLFMMAGATQKYFSHEIQKIKILMILDIVLHSENIYIKCLVL